MAIRISTEHYSLQGIRYKVEIHDNDYGGATVTNFKDNGFEITWNSESDNLLDPIKSSECRYTLYEEDNTDWTTFKADLVSADEDEFQLVIYKHNGSGWDLHWTGVIMTDQTQWRNENAPREFQINAKDGLNRINDLVFENIKSSPFTTAPQLFIYIITQILAKNNLASIHTGDYIKVSIDWYDTQMTPTAPQRVFERVRIWGDLLRTEQPDNSDKIADIEPMKCGDILKGLLQIFAARIIYSDGCYHIQQPSNFTTDTYSIAVYDNTGTYVRNDTGVTNKTSIVVDSASRLMGDIGIFGHHAAYKRVKSTPKGYLDIKGAYIDKIEVNRATTTVTQTMLLGTIQGGIYATASKTTSSLTNTFKAENAGSAGNSIALVFDGIDNTATVVSTWNAANPNNKVLITSGSNAIVHGAGTTTLSGGAGASGRTLEIDFDINNATNNKVKASNIITTVDVKLICGSYRIKNVAGYTNTGVSEWSTTAADKWTYTKAGYNTSSSKIQIQTPEIPFEEEANCTLELTITLSKKNGAAWIDPTDPAIWPTNTWDYFSTLRAFRVIAWDTNVDTATDIEVVVNNPTQTNTSLEFDYGKILIGDNPVVQSSISSKNNLEIYNSLGTWKRSNVWAASFDTDYGLVTTMMMEQMALRKTPIQKYMGGFVGVYSAWKSIGYDSARWVMNQVKYDSNTDEWVGSWWYINYSRADITKSEERILPPTTSAGPYKKGVTLIDNKINDPQLVNGKGTGATPYEAGAAAVTAIDVDALDNNKFKSGDSLMVYHPTTLERLQTFVVNADTTVSDTSITVVSAAPTSDIPVGAILEHNSKEVVASQVVRAEYNITLNSQWVNVTSITQADFSASTYQMTIDQQYLICNLDGGSYNVRFPLGSTSLKHGKSIILTVKCLNGVITVYPHTSDSGASIVTNGALSSLIISGGQNISFVWDGTNWQRIGL